MSRETFFFLNCAGRCVPERAPPGVGLWDEMKDGGGNADRQAGRQAGKRPLSRLARRFCYDTT